MSTLLIIWQGQDIYIVLSYLTAEDILVLFMILDWNLYELDKAEKYILRDEKELIIWNYLSF